MPGSAAPSPPPARRERSVKVKSAGGEIEAELTTRNAMCNSACSYQFLGATTREVAPDAMMAVHNSKLTLVVHGQISAQQMAESLAPRLSSGGVARDLL